MGDANPLEDAGRHTAAELDFVNRDIDRHLETWRHLDERVLGAAPPFLTLTAALVPAAVLLAGTVDDPRRFYIACAPLLVFVASIGLLVAMRVMNVGMRKKGCLLHVALLRGYVTQQLPSLRGYATPCVTPDAVRDRVRDLGSATSGRVPVIACTLTSALLTGAAAALLVWWIWEHAGVVALAISVALGAGLAYGIELALLRWRRQRTAGRIADDFGLGHTRSSATSKDGQ